MRIGIDLRFTAANRMGTGTYAEQAALAIGKAAANGDTVLGFSAAPALPPDLAKYVTHVRVPMVATGIDSELVERALWDAAIARAGVDVWFAPTGLAPAFATCPSVITVHDLLFEHNPSCFAPPLLAHLKREIPRSVARSSLLVAISRFTQQDVFESYGVPLDRVRVVTQELSVKWSQRPDESSIVSNLAAVGVKKPYVLHLSNLAPHKNPIHSLEIFAAWIQQRGDNTHQLIIAGGGPAPQAPMDLQSAINRLGLQARVRILGPVDGQALPALYAGAAVLLMSSLFEGWGLPSLEAMAMGTPAIVSNRGALPESVGNGAIVLPLEDRERWIDALDRLTKTGPSPALRLAMSSRVQEVQRPQGETLLQILHEASTLSPIGHQHIPVVKTQETHQRTVQLSGCMIIKNGVKLGYPFVEAISAVIDFVEEMVVVDGHSQDGTWETLKQMAAVCPKLLLHRQEWPTTNTGGQVIAEATNNALTCCTGSHILYVQADEIFPEDLLRRIRELLVAGFNSAAVPFLHFRSGWDKVIANPAYVATIRCVPNHPTVRSVGDATSFAGPLGPCAMPEEFLQPVFHVGWVYTQNILAKHQNHATIYVDLDDYQRKARAAQKLDGHQGQSEVAMIDAEYELIPYRGSVPSVIQHLPSLQQYDPTFGLRRWFEHWNNE